MKFNLYFKDDYFKHLENENYKKSLIITADDLCDAIFQSFANIYIEQSKWNNDKISFNGINIFIEYDSNSDKLTTNYIKIISSGPEFNYQIYYLCCSEINDDNKDIFNNIEEICIKDNMIYIYENYKEGLKCTLRYIVIPNKCIDTLNDMDTFITNKIDPNFIKKSTADTIFG
jgi:hypothetical protein